MYEYTRDINLSLVLPINPCCAMRFDSTIWSQLGSNKSFSTLISRKVQINFDMIVKAAILLALSVIAVESIPMLQCMYDSLSILVDLRLCFIIMFVFSREQLLIQTLLTLAVLQIGENVAIWLLDVSEIVLVMVLIRKCSALLAFIKHMKPMDARVASAWQDKSKLKVCLISVIFIN